MCPKIGSVPAGVMNQFLIFGGYYIWSFSPSRYTDEEPSDIVFDHKLTKIKI
jgi:hypothetical protein